MTRSTPVNLKHNYQPVSVTLDIAADQTNVCISNLISIGYVSATQKTRDYLEWKGVANESA
jgi:hypothetical protein